MNRPVWGTLRFHSTARPLLLGLVAVALLVTDLSAQLIRSDDSTIAVQAFTFADDPGPSGTFDDTITFPASGGRYERVLMYYTLKCDARTTQDNFPCGEWDYSTWINVWDDAENHWEIGRFITPYGINLSLGPDGFTWVFDVTDYAPILVGSKRVTAGNKQELLDLRFEFIKGVPARDPISVTRLWDAGNPGYADIVNDVALAPTTVQLDENASMYRVNVRPQGGNFNGGANTDNCAEFCDREHWLTIDGTERFRWNVWKECGANPVFPQGGTWIYDRAGWCPGDIVTTTSLELTPFVTPGQEVVIDYGIENPPQFTPYGHWVFWADLVAYGAPNFPVDAGLEAILAPSTHDLYSRNNPICGSPVIVIRNGGETELESVRITYGMEGSTPVDYEWSGSLPFLALDTVTLPPLPLEEWDGETGRFVVTLSNPNGTADPYAPNNSGASIVAATPRLPSDFEIRLQTNNLANISSSNYILEVFDAEGNTVLLVDDLPAATLGSFPLSLPDGCYTLRLTNPEGLGLDFWAIRDQLGTGSLSIVADGKTVKTFGADFGNEIVYNFRTPVARLESEADSIDFGKQGLNSRTIRTFVISPANAVGLDVHRAVLLTGRNAFEIVETRPSIEDTLAHLEDGEALEIDVAFTPTEEEVYTGRLSIVSSDIRGNYTLFVSGTGDAESSVPMAGVSMAEIVATPSITSGKLFVSLDEAFMTDNDRIEVELIDMSGASLGSVPVDRISRSTRGVELDLSFLPAGAYRIVVNGDARSLSTSIRIVR